jgi:hypothetical protein
VSRAINLTLTVIVTSAWHRPGLVGFFVLGLSQFSPPGVYNHKSHNRINVRVENGFLHPPPPPPPSALVPPASSMLSRHSLAMVLPMSTCRLSSIGV